MRASLFPKHPNTVKDVVVAETICPLLNAPVKVSFEMNGVRGKLTVLEKCSIKHSGEQCDEGCRKNPELLTAIHQKMEEIRAESAREIPIISTP
ncbi:MAG: hypothetical protein AABZ34_06220 [Nitrospirota bacterium]